MPPTLPSDPRTAVRRARIRMWLDEAAFWGVLILIQIPGYEKVGWSIVGLWFVSLAVRSIPSGGLILRTTL
ncbi:MAG: hypothetical protein IPK07_25215 [Deltaproteobacteria bacterium]|nr:hypothetical protein [Deltaproteobacteria bacterium]